MYLQFTPTFTLLTKLQRFIYLRHIPAETYLVHSANHRTLSSKGSKQHGHQYLITQVRFDLEPSTADLIDIQRIPCGDVMWMWL
jgi:hypothetical protein